MPGTGSGTLGATGAMDVPGSRALGTTGPGGAPDGLRANGGTPKNIDPGARSPMTGSE